MTRLILLMTVLITSCNSGSKTPSTCSGNCKNGKGYELFGENSEFSGDTYRGEFDKGLYNGHGTYYDKSEDSKYIGYWKDGLPNGKGLATWGEKSKYPNRSYDGEWMDGLMHGTGTKFWGIAETDEYTNNKYIGEWKNDEMDGIGKYEWADGSYYEGSWKNGEQHSEGIYVFADGEVFKGIWINGYCEELAIKLGLE